MTRPCFIFDLDGTLADNDRHTHTTHDMIREAEAISELILGDPAVESMRMLMRALTNSYYRTHSNIVCTGRPTILRKATTEWMGKRSIPYDRLMMRGNHDHRPDAEVKRSMLQTIREMEYEPVMVFEDRQSVVDMWRSEGLICHQVAKVDL